MGAADGKGRVCTFLVPVKLQRAGGRRPKIDAAGFLRRGHTPAPFVGQSRRGLGCWETEVCVPISQVQPGTVPSRDMTVRGVWA